MHELAAGADGADGVGEGEGAGGDVGGVLAEAVAGGVGDGEVAGFEFGFECAQGGDGDGEDGGLGVLGLFEGVFGAVEDDAGEGEVEGVVGFFEDGAGGRIGIVEGSAHAYGLGALAGEEESDGGGCGRAHQDSLAAGVCGWRVWVGRAVLRCVSRWVAILGLTIHNRLVMVLAMPVAAANSVFRALADPTRRAIFERLTREGELTVHVLTVDSGVSQPAVSKHLTVLKRARLVNKRRDGRETHYRAEPKALAPLVDWISFYGVFWKDRFDRLEDVLERMEP